MPCAASKGAATVCWVAIPSSNVSDTTVCARALETHVRPTARSVRRMIRPAREERANGTHRLAKAGFPSVGLRLAAANESDADQGSRNGSVLASEIHSQARFQAAVWLVAAAGAAAVAERRGVVVVRLRGLRHLGLRDRAGRAARVHDVDVRSDRELDRVPDERRPGAFRRVLQGTCCAAFAPGIPLTLNSPGFWLQAE